MVSVQCSCERESGAMNWIVPRAPLGIFHTQHGFIPEDVGIGAAEPPGCCAAMKVKHEMVLGGQLGGVVVELDAELIAALNEVDLDAGYSPFLVERKGLIHL